MMLVYDTVAFSASALSLSLSQNKLTSSDLSHDLIQSSIAFSTSALSLSLSQNKLTGSDLSHDLMQSCCIDRKRTASVHLPMLGKLNKQCCVLL